MNIHAGLRSDIVDHYFTWLQTRVTKGYYYERINDDTLKKIDLRSTEINKILFWTKKPSKIIKNISVAKKFNDYEIVTVFSMYDKFYEPNLKLKKHDMISKFRTFSSIVGSNHLAFCYGPIFYNNNYDEKIHLSQFEFLCYCLKNHTKKVYLDFNINSNCQDTPLYKAHKLTTEEKEQFVEKATTIAKKYGMKTFIKPTYIEIAKNGDIDMAIEDTCPSKCVFCPYNTDDKKIAQNESRHSSRSDLLIDKKKETDEIL